MNTHCRAVRNNRSRIWKYTNCAPELCSKTGAIKSTLVNHFSTYVGIMNGSMESMPDIIARSAAYTSVLVLFNHVIWYSTNPLCFHCDK